MSDTKVRGPHKAAIGARRPSELRAEDLCGKDEIDRLMRQDRMERERALAEIQQRLMQVPEFWMPEPGIDDWRADEPEGRAA